MNIRNILIIIGIIAVILLIAQYVVQVRRIKSGDNYVSGGRAFINWLLLFVIVGSFGGSVYANHRQKTEPAVSNVASSSSEEEDDQVYVNFDKSKARLNDNGVAPMKLVVSPGTKVKIVGHRSGTVYKTFTTKKGDGPVTVKYKFEYAAKYDIIATKNGKKITKHITIKDQESESSSSESSSSASSSSSSSSHASSSSSNSFNSNQSNNTGNSGSSNNGGGGSSYTPRRTGGGGGGYSGGGATISNQPTINNQPIQNQ